MVLTLLGLLLLTDLTGGAGFLSLRTGLLLRFPALLAEEPPLITKLRAQGAEHYRERRYYQAIRSVERALDIAEEAQRAELSRLLGRFRAALGVELFNTGENRQAEEVFREALVHSADPYAHFGLGFLHFVRLEDEDARKELTEAARLDPSYSQTQKLLALMDYRQGDSASALQKIRKACELDPEDAEAKALSARWTLERGYTEKFVEKSVRGFLLRVDPRLPSGQVKRVVRLLKRARKEIASVFGLKEDRRIAVVLFAEERFHQATGSFHWVGGVFDGQIKLPVKVGKGDSKDRDELGAAVRHEMVHVAVREVCPECPNWLNEGIAQYFEGEVDSLAMRRLLREGAARKISFRKVPARLWEVDDEALARWTYLQGLGFVRFLARRFHPFRLRLCLEAITREQSVAKAFETTYGARLEVLESLWWEEVEANE